LGVRISSGAPLNQGLADHVDTKDGSMRYYFGKKNKEGSAVNAVKKWIDYEESK